MGAGPERFVAGPDTIGGMTTPGADRTREDVRHSGGHSGDQLHTEAKVDAMGPEAADPDLYTGWITVDQSTMDCVEKIATLRGAHEDDNWNKG